MPAPPPERRWFPLDLRDISLGGAGIAIRKEDAPCSRERGRYLLQTTIAETTFFIVCRMIKVFRVDEEGRIEAGMAYEGLPAFTEKLMGAFIRQQELNTRSA